MKIQFSPPDITLKEIEAVTKVLKSKWLTMGPKTIEFENKFSKYIGSKFSIAVNSCTSALFLSLKALNIQPGDEIITTTFTFAATANTIIHCGAKPILVDIDPNTYNINTKEIEKRISSKTKAIVVVHYGGQSADMDNIMKIARKYDLKVIEDAAHAAGSRYSNGKKIGNMGNLTCFSFYATKNLTTGEGGMITCNDNKLVKRLKNLRLHGMSKDAWKRYYGVKSNWYYDITEPGYKCNMTDINAALGLIQLQKLDRANNKRRSIALKYNKQLNELDVQLPFIDNKNESAYHLFPIQLNSFNRDQFINDMNSHGIATSVHFIPLHMMSYYQNEFGYQDGDFPISEKVFHKIVSLPIYPQLSDSQLKYIIRTIKKILR